MEAVRTVKRSEVPQGKGCYTYRLSEKEKVWTKNIRQAERLVDAPFFEATGLKRKG